MNEDSISALENILNVKKTKELNGSPKKKAASEDDKDSFKQSPNLIDDQIDRYIDPNDDTKNRFTKENEIQIEFYEMFDINEL